MASKSSHVLLAVVLVGLAVCSIGVQTRPATPAQDAYTVPPKGTVTVRTVLSQGETKTETESTAPVAIKLSPCAQAILGCCVAEVPNRQHCFEQIGCGPHIFGDPCDKNFMSQALVGAEKFYGQFTPNTIAK